MIGFREKLKAMEILESTIWFPSLNITAWNSNQIVIYVSCLSV
ncbi:hypothetical protein NC652_012450 [Populus alba x Populus x berolinensis]|nr:hypothetical protein NC652_012450 [Populus alba x Populus x berolinensis]